MGAARVRQAFWGAEQLSPSAKQLRALRWTASPAEWTQKPYYKKQLRTLRASVILLVTTTSRLFTHIINIS